MGEAKRRKKLMGKDYGKKPQQIVKGTIELEEHIDKLAEAWHKRVEEALYNFSDEEIRFEDFEYQRKLGQQWFKEHLEIYSQDILEPSENFPENPQGTPKEIPQKNQNETIFYQ